MHWVIQENLHGERGFDTLVQSLQRLGISHDLVKVIPFVGETIPDVNPPNPVFVIGSMSMHRVAERKGWNPGVVLIPDFVQMWRSPWQPHLLNYDALVIQIADVDRGCFEDGNDQLTEMFIRPIADSKAFTGTIMGWDEFREWRERLKVVSSENPTCGLETEVLIAGQKTIHAEYRFFVVNDRIVTGSVYKRGGRVIYEEVIDKDVLMFAKSLVTPMSTLYWRPADIYVLDVASTPNGFKVVEINNLNSAGFYAADVGKLVGALEGWGWGSRK